MKKIIKLTESDLHRIVKRVIQESQTPPNKVSAGKRCWYYNKIAGKKYDVDNRVPNPFSGAGGVQDFLIALGWNISKDWDFGNQTAKALAFCRYGAKSGIDTVNKLWLQLKKDGYDVGETTGYGPKMKKAVAEMIVKTCGEISKMCKVDAQTLFDMDFKISKEDEKVKYELVPKALDDSFKYAIGYWREYLKKPEVQQKIWNNMSVFDFLTNHNLSSLMEEYFNALDTIEKKGWVDSSTSAKEIGAIMYVSGDCPKYTVCVNVNNFLTTYKKNGMGKVRSNAKDSFVHEIQHIMWGEVQQLNSSISIKQAFPSSVDRYGKLNKGEESPPIENLTKNGIENWSNFFYKVPEESLKELKDLGISYENLKEYFSEDEYSSYVCDENEKLSNLAAYRRYLTDNGTIKLGGDIPIDVMVKEINNLEFSPNNFDYLIICWVISGMQPKLSVFVNELNSLAQKELKPKDDDPTQIDNNLV
jgi:hypothetical protein